MIILAPIERYLEAQGLTDVIDTIAYSTDFPYGVNFDDDVKAVGLQAAARDLEDGVADRPDVLLPPRAREGPRGLPAARRRTATSADRRARPPGRVSPHRPGAPAARRRAGRDAVQGLAARRRSLRRSSPRRIPTQAEHWYNLACCLALLGEAGPGARRAREGRRERLSRREARRPRTSTSATSATGPTSSASSRRCETCRCSSRRAPSRRRTPGRAATRPRPTAPTDTVDRYRLAVMLGWTGPHGNTQDEVLACLRSRRRQRRHVARRHASTSWSTATYGRRRAMPCVRGAPSQTLRRRGRTAEILDAGQGRSGRRPAEGQGRRARPGRGHGELQVAGRHAAAAAGLDRGAPDLVRRALRDGRPDQVHGVHPPRRGGHVRHGRGALRHLQQKFPLPFIHDHYAQGCSLAEAFYQSVWGPYQLLILGDPLTRPFAHFSTVSLVSPDASEPWREHGRGRGVGVGAPRRRDGEHRAVGGREEARRRQPGHEARTRHDPPRRRRARAAPRGRRRGADPHALVHEAPVRRRERDPHAGRRARPPRPSTTARSSRSRARPRASRPSSCSAVRRCSPRHRSPPGGGRSPCAPRAWDSVTSCCPYAAGTHRVPRS